MRTVWIFMHEGVYPVGSCSVVTTMEGEGVAEARINLRALLAEHSSLKSDADQITKDASVYWRTGTEDRIILDGNY